MTSCETLENQNVFCFLDNSLVLDLDHEGFAVGIENCHLSKKDTTLSFLATEQPCRSTKEIPGEIHTRFGSTGASDSTKTFGFQCLDGGNLLGYELDITGSFDE
jgi:hypothetical protein